MITGLYLLIKGFIVFCYGRINAAITPGTATNWSLKALLLACGLDNLSGLQALPALKQEIKTTICESYISAELAAASWRGYIPDPEKPRPDTIERDIVSACKATGVDCPLFRAVIKAESAQDHDALSRKGALGLGQVMPFHVDTCNLKSARALLEPASNLLCAAKILKSNLNKAKGDKRMALSLYNWGKMPGKNGAMPEETKNYINTVIRYYGQHN